MRFPEVESRDRAVQIGTPEELVTNPATDYVRRFVSKVPPALVVRVASLMSAPIGNENIAEGIPVNATISEVASKFVSAPETVPVVDERGQIVGSINSKRALETLTSLHR